MNKADNKNNNSVSIEEKLIAEGMTDVTDTIKTAQKDEKPSSEQIVKPLEDKADAAVNTAVNTDTQTTVNAAEPQKSEDTEETASVEAEPDTAVAETKPRNDEKKTNRHGEKVWGIQDYLLQLKNGVLDQNPILVQLLGTCPTLATSTSVENAFGMGIAATAVLMCSNLLISLLRHIIPKQIRIAAYIVIISGFVTAVEMLISAFFPELNKSLGVFIPLIVVNCIILARAEAFASKNPPLPSLVDGISMGIGFTLALVVLGAIRELLGTGGIMGVNLLGASYQPAIIFIMPPGAFITLGCIIAVVQKLRMVNDRRKAYAESGVTKSQLKEERRAEKLRARAERDEKIKLEQENQKAEADEEKENAEAGRENAR